VNDFERALELAKRGMGKVEGHPLVGAVVVADGEVVGEGWYEYATVDHAEVRALAQAGERARGATLYVTLEPCAMCMGAVFNARVARVVFGAWDAKAGACGSVIDLPRERRLAQGVDVFGGVCSEESALLLRQFFERRR
jgi:tRNA(adenine34) deaminase